MRSEVPIYTGTVRITEKSTYKYPIGQKHAFLLYLREDVNTAYDQEHAEQVIPEIGLDEVTFSRVGKLDPTKISNDKKKNTLTMLSKNGQLLSSIPNLFNL